MNKLYSLLAVLLAATLLFTTTGCEPEDPEFGTLNLTLENLEDLGPDYVYEGWLMFAGSPVSTGTFTVDADGNLNPASFEVDFPTLEGATDFILSIEPFNDADPAPSNTKVLAGAFSGSSAALSIGDANAVGTDFSTATGGYIMATPTNGPASNETSGVWFLNPTGPVASLDLPTLGDGWIYEGWAVIDGTPVSTGTFRSGDGPDSGNPHSGSQPAPAFPGEDFFIDPPAGISFTPAPSLLGATMVVSVEPVPDNSTAPFVLKPLAHLVDANATAGTYYTMDSGGLSQHPRGAATR